MSKRKQGKYIVTIHVSPELVADSGFDIRAELRSRLDQQAECLATARSKYIVVESTERYEIREGDIRYGDMMVATIRAYIARQTKQGYRVEY